MRAGLRQSPMLESPEQLLCLVRIDIEADMVEAARLSFGTVRYDGQIEVSIAQIDRLALWIRHPPLTQDPLRRRRS